MKRPDLNRVLLALCLFSLLIPLSGCQTTYYNTLEKVGIHKRDIMVDRVGKARDAQQDAKEQFASALDRFKSVVAFDGGSLEDKYKTLKSEYDKSEARAAAVRSRIEGVEDVSEALFDEWEAELTQYSSPKLRADSKRKLDNTRQQYKQLIIAMKRAEKKISPILTAFNDQVLYLKHNLNAQAIASLQHELIAVEDDIAVLITDMDKSIREADAFISAMLKE